MASDSSSSSPSSETSVSSCPVSSASPANPRYPSRRRVKRACSDEIAAARFWSSQKPGSPIASSSSAIRTLSASGSKVITDPAELGPDLLHLSLEGGAVGHQQDPSDGFGRGMWRRLAARLVPDRSAEIAAQPKISAD